MKKNSRVYKQEEGFVLVTCMMIMMVLTIVGIMASTTTQMELMISGNDKVAKSAFFRADSGIFTAPKVVRETLSTGPTLDIRTMKINDLPVGDSQLPFYRELMGFSATAGNINFDQGEGNIDADILRSGETPLVGDSTEFASGFDAGGGGGGMAVGLLYTITSTGTAPGNAVSQLEAVYRFIPGRPGGL